MIYNALRCSASAAPMLLAALVMLCLVVALLNAGL